MDITQNLTLFRELILCGSKVCTWRYDKDGHLLESNCPSETVLGAAFSVFGISSYLKKYTRKYRSPLIFTTEAGLVWGAAFEQENDWLKQVHTIGPVFFSDASLKSIEQWLNHIESDISVAWKRRFLEALYEIPAVPFTTFSRYVLMLHYCVTGEHLNVCDLYQYQFSSADDVPALSVESKDTLYRDRSMVYLAERNILEKVRLGDLDYQDALNTSMMLSEGVPLENTDLLRREKTTNTVFCTLVSRAAIEGGLSPEEAYSLGDYYIQAGENAASHNDLAALPLTMYDDFVRRVHKRRSNPAYSAQIQKCCDYIDLHLGEKIRAADLGSLTGYSEYYITRQFQKETGQSVSGYIKSARIERAKLLLAYTSHTVMEVADQLGFSTPSYFIQSFREVTGMTPADYRAAHKNL